ncbi:hypothetical protein BDZ97DRAFT_491743 [Flammula alnicola]|nr:hypothetical protein BDZ97DRAFT_491743 [Flammula alnicola]
MSRLQSMPRVRPAFAIPSTSLPRLPSSRRRRKQPNVKRRKQPLTMQSMSGFPRLWQRQTSSPRFNKKPRYFLNIFFHGGARMVNHHEKINPHNAFISLKAQELRDDGQSMSLLSIQCEYKEEYCALGEDEREEIVKEYKENMNGTKHIARPSPRGRIQDFANTVRNIIMLINGLKTRVGIEGFFCIVRNTPTYHMQPQWLGGTRTTLARHTL